MQLKKSYMNRNNIISENFLKDFLTLWKTGKFRALQRMTKDRASMKALKDLNDAAAALDKLGQKRYGRNYKRNRYKLSDFFLS